MKWHSKDIKQYSKAKEFVDTLFIPLIPFHLSSGDVEKRALQNEVMSIYANEIEQSLTGRVMLVPHYYYLSSKDLQLEVERLNEWIQSTNNELFKHVFLLTFDSTWRKFEQQLDGTLIWLPGMYSGKIYSEEVTQMISDQVEELIELIRSYW